MPKSSTKASIALLRLAKLGFMQSRTSSQIRRGVTVGASALVMLGCGIVAAPSAHATGYTVLYSFAGAPNDGDRGYGGLVIDKSGNLKGATIYGGANDYGTVFSLDTAGNETVLDSFDGALKNGGYPTPGMIRHKGILYGTVNHGVYGGGGIYKVNKRNKVSIVYGFCQLTNCADGFLPQYGVISDDNGNLYGSTPKGGAYGYGVVFKVNATGKEKVLHSFCADQNLCTDGDYPTGGLVRDQGGNLYGTTQGGGGNQDCASGQYPCGTVFKIDATGNYSVLYSFKGPANGDGSNPYGTPILDKNGNLYGTTLEGGTGTQCGTSGCGIVFKIDSSGNETVLYSFTGGADGQYPEFNGLVRSSGNLYGTTVAGGAYGYGTVFKLDSTGVETVLHDFTGGTDGSEPNIGLIKDKNGNLYGMTNFGGNLSCTEEGSGCGVVYKITP